ncbi:MAG: DUF2281 domain-containing protein [Candidatus Hydrogenedentes bacterium]|nr:DUF2281 domain-containing protein [Candidatus Hydrogenedentota bacterium]
MDQKGVDFSAGSGPFTRRLPVNIEAKVIESLRALPPERQFEVLEFVEFLKSRTSASQIMRPAGLCRGEFIVPDGFDAPLPDEVLREFEG